MTKSVQGPTFPNNCLSNNSSNCLKAIVQTNVEAIFQTIVQAIVQAIFQTIVQATFQTIVQKIIQTKAILQTDMSTIWKQSLLTQTFNDRIRFVILCHCKLPNLPYLPSSTGAQCLM